MNASRRHGLKGGSAHEEEQGTKESSLATEGLCCTLIPSADRSSVDSTGADEAAPAGWGGASCLTRLVSESQGPPGLRHCCQLGMAL